jgi:hypothetical protein
MVILMMVCFILGSCGPKPMYKTKEGKKKLKKYNALQFGDPRAK